jgi:hypothetical protein
MRKTFILTIMILILVFMINCAPGPNQMTNSPNEMGEVAGFWKGLWQGFIAPITFIISLFNDNVHLYEVHNSGNWYNFGYLLGLMTFFGGGGGGAGRRSRSCK